MRNDLFIEMECQQFTKTGQNACGDDYQFLSLEKENRSIAVLSDGLGSGVKANLLANMTTTMALRFMRSNIDVLRSVETIMDSLPICEIRKISYATFSIVDLRLGGITRVVEMGNPQYIHLRNNLDIPAQKHSTIVSQRWPDREVDCYELRLEPGDRLILCSDGVTQAGLGKKPYKFGWRRQGELEFIQEIIRNEPDIPARDLAYAIAAQAVTINSGRCVDDTSCMVIYLRHPRVLRILTGPPYHKDHDRDFAALASVGDANAVVICGGTTANIIQRELNKKVEIDMKLVRQCGELPPPGRIRGVGLVTEGIMTLSRVCTALEKNEPLASIPLAAREIVNLVHGNDLVEFVVGTKVNEAHQDPNLPMELELRRNVVKRLANVLESQYRKKVEIQYF